MTILRARSLVLALTAAIGVATASTAPAAPAGWGPPPIFKIKKLKLDVLICTPHAVRNYLIVHNHHAAKTFPKGGKIFYIAQRAGGGIVAKGWYTLKRALKPGQRVRIRYGTWPLPRTRKASICRTYVKYWG